MKRHVIRAAAFAALCLPMLPQAAGAYPPIPAPFVEVVPAAPGPAYVWRQGAWRWNGNGYVWARGEYVPRRPFYHAWVPGHWGPAGHWVPAHWR